jgi:membrane-associated phospholipid phosphatase
MLSTIGCGLLVLAYLARFDEVLSGAARHVAVHGIPGGLAATTLQNFIEFMDQSVFEGAGFGAGDFPLLLQIGAFLGYVLSLFRFAPESLKKCRSALAYMWVSALVTAGGIHLFKGLIARPRPYDVLKGSVAFHPWFEVYTAKMFAFGRGSFPSGHTASVMTLWSAVMVFRWRFPKRRFGLWLLAMLCFLASFAMAFARVAHGDHWPTDTLGSIGFTLAVCTLVAPMMLGTGAFSEPSTQQDQVVDRPTDVLLWWTALWLVLGAFYLAVKLTLVGNPLLGTAAFFVSFGGGYGVSVARTRSTRT